MIVRSFSIMGYLSIKTGHFGPQFPPLPTTTYLPQPQLLPIWRKRPLWVCFFPESVCMFWCCTCCSRLSLDFQKQKAVGGYVSLQEPCSRKREHDYQKKKENRQAGQFCHTPIALVVWSQVNIEGGRCVYMCLLASSLQHNVPALPPLTGPL